jgi:DNA-binding response OmpR family regulator
LESFDFLLPAYARLLAPWGGARTVDLQPSSYGQPTILLVDDEPTLLETLSYNLRRERYNVLTAQDGPAAVLLANDHHPDLVILDLMLPGMDGFEVCRTLRRDLTLPIMVLSALEDEAYKSQVLADGADHYLTKPFDLRELLLRVQVLLSRA